MKNLYEDGEGIGFVNCSILARQGFNCLFKCYVKRLMVFMAMLLLVVHNILAQSKSMNKFPETTEGVIIGDSLPDWFWEVKLNLINDPSGLGTFDLKDYKDKLLVLDFWGAFCVPCIESLDKWDKLLPEFKEDVSVIGIHIFYPDTLAEPFTAKRGWSLPITVGNDVDSLLNQLFYAQTRFGQVWIKDGKLLAIPRNRSVNRELVAAVVENRSVDFEMEVLLTHFDPRITELDNQINNENF